jgi:hypothetical protein
MAEKLNPTTAEEKDVTKAQSAQQPQAQAKQEPETDEQRQQAEFGQAEPTGQPDEGLQGETLAQQRNDVEGALLQPKERAEEESGFIGTEGSTDTSGKLVEEEDEDEDFRPDGE